MNKYLRERLARIEARVKADPVVLTMPNGTQHHIRGTSRHFFKLFRYIGMLKSETIPPAERDGNLDREVAWLRSAVEIKDPDGMGVLFSGMLAGLVRNRHSVMPEVE